MLGWPGHSRLSTSWAGHSLLQPLGSEAAAKCSQPSPFAEGRNPTEGIAAHSDTDWHSGVGIVLHYLQLGIKIQNTAWA